MKNQQAKNTHIEILRGGVIILVVIGHVIGSGHDGGMRVDDQSFLRYFYCSVIDPIQMPLFTVIAGLVYAMRPVTIDKAKSFILKKVARILVPMLVVGVCYFLLQYFTPGTNRKGELKEMWRLLIFPYTLFWYLYSLFLVFLVVTAIDSFRLMNSLRNWMILFGVSTFLLLIRDVVIPYSLPNLLSYKGAIYLLPCFLLGTALHRFKAFFQTKIIVYSVPLVLLACVAIQQLSWFKLVDFTVQKDNLVGLSTGLAATMLLLRIRLQMQWLVWVGGFAYSIYLFHAFGTAGGRIITQQLHIQSMPLVFMLSLAAGLLLPVVAEKLLQRFKITRTLFLGS